ncbi:hypothetical protein CPB85DRAFT_1536278 [Mucidula mucida]|nr:hypothetical protein CPB85DRAFT_1536278 [Mucidula mucida]
MDAGSQKQSLLTFLPLVEGQGRMITWSGSTYPTTVFSSCNIILVKEHAPLARVPLSLGIEAFSSRARWLGVVGECKARLRPLFLFLLLSCCSFDIMNVPVSDRDWRDDNRPRRTLNPPDFAGGNSFSFADSPALQYIDEKVPIKRSSNLSPFRSSALPRLRRTMASRLQQLHTPERSDRPGHGGYVRIWNVGYGHSNLKVDDKRERNMFPTTHSLADLLIFNLGAGSLVDRDRCDDERLSGMEMAQRREESIWPSGGYIYTLRGREVMREEVFLVCYLRFSGQEACGGLRFIRTAGGGWDGCCQNMECTRINYGPELIKERFYSAADISIRATIEVLAPLVVFTGADL